MTIICKLQFINEKLIQVQKIQGYSLFKKKEEKNVRNKD